MIRTYISENEPRMLDELFSLIRIPSISAKPEHHDEMLACAERWRQLLLEAGADPQQSFLGISALELASANRELTGQTIERLRQKP